MRVEWDGIKGMSGGEIVVGEGVMGVWDREGKEISEGLL